MAIAESWAEKLNRVEKRAALARHILELWNRGSLQDRYEAIAKINVDQRPLRLMAAILCEASVAVERGHIETGQAALQLAAHFHNERDRA